MNEIVFLTENEYGYNVKFSPHDSSLIAVVSGTNYGISGSGSLWLLKLVNKKLLVLSRQIWQDVIVDVDWNPSDPTILSTVSGDGSVTVWSSANGDLKLLKTLKEHSVDGSSIVWPNWSHNSNIIFSSSWDGSIKMWDSNTFTKSLATIRFRDIERVNDISFSKMEPGKISVSTSSGNVIFWDVRTQMPQQTLRHGCDVLTHDVSKFEPNIVVTGGVNRAILVWDLRNCRYPVVVLHGHSHPVKKIVTSFHSRPEFTSTSFDFSVRLWNFSSCLEIINHHTEFVTSLDLDQNHPGVFVDSSWDRSVKISVFKSR